MPVILAYHVTVFLSAFLLFAVQPMTSKALLPYFGGSYLVWGACMVFYQVMLLLGYVFAHAVQKRLGVYRYSRAHLILLALPLIFMPFRFETFAAPALKLPLAFEIFAILFAAVGLPVFVLATTSLILQSWLSISGLPQRANPYVLYGASNLGSIMALLFYPLLVEPTLTLAQQSRLWQATYLALLTAHLFCLPKKGSETAAAEQAAAPRIPFRLVAEWFLLAFAACAMLLAVTNELTLDIASVPMLWILPLSVYLLSFVLTFKRHPWFPPWLEKATHWALILGTLLYLLTQLRLGLTPWPSITLHLLILFAICLTCTGRLIATKPRGQQGLTFFYLVLALGGVAGSLIVSWVAPLVSSSLIEYPASLFLVALAFAFRETDKPLEPAVPGIFVRVLICVSVLILIPWAYAQYAAAHGGKEYPTLLLVATSLPLGLLLLQADRRPRLLAFILFVVTICFNWTEQLTAGVTNMNKHRNFYGIYKVYDKNNLRYLQLGTTQHGRQYLSGPKRETPLAYYHPTTPAAEVLAQGRPCFSNIGMIGLGTGALTAYTGAGQHFTIFELDPDNLPIARNSFTYLDIAERNGAKLEFVFGDGRISLGKRTSGAFDLFIVDAFSSDAIPVHLITVEALREYLRVLGDNGLLLLHVSNNMLNLEPIVFSNVSVLGVHACQRIVDNPAVPDAAPTHWMAVSRNSGRIRALCQTMGWYSVKAGAKPPAPWTDQYSDIFGAMLRK